MSAQPAREPAGTPRGGQFATGSTAEPEGVGLTVAAAPVVSAPMSHEDHRFLAGESGRFSQGYTDEDINAVLENIEGAEMVCVWDRTEGGDFTGDSEIVGRVGDGPWRSIHPELWDHLAGEDDALDGGSCSECGAECVVEEDGTSHHLSQDGSVDYDADADHVALDESLMENPVAAPVLDPDTPLLSDEPFEVHGLGPRGLDDCVRSGANIALESDDDDDDGDGDVCSCGASLDDGEGYDGLCGNCADRVDNELQHNDEPRDYDEDRAYEALVDAGFDSDICDEVSRQAVTFRAAFESARAAERMADDTTVLVGGR